MAKVAHALAEEASGDEALISSTIFRLRLDEIGASIEQAFGFMQVEGISVLAISNRSDKILGVLVAPDKFNVLHKVVTLAAEPDQLAAGERMFQRLARESVPALNGCFVAADELFSFEAGE